MSKLGDNIKELRAHFKMSISELSKKSEVGRSTISEIETGKATNPKSDTLTRIAEAFGVPLTLLFQDNPVEFLEDDFTSEIIDGIKTPESNFKFTDPAAAVKFILEQPTLMAYGGYDLESMTEEEILQVADDMLLAMRLSIEKMKKK